MLAGAFPTKTAAHILRTNTIHNCFFFVNVNMQGIKTPLYGLSMYASESPEWVGILPLGQSVENYTISIAGEHLQENSGRDDTSSVYDAIRLSWTCHRSCPVP